MNIDQATEVADYLDYEFGTSIEVRGAYSGRGMYGAEVPAFVLDDGDVMFVGFAFGVLGLASDDMPQRVDNMGMQVVIY